MSAGTQHACATGAGVLGFFAIACAVRGLWWETALFGFVSLFLVEAGLRDARATLSAVLAAERTTRPPDTARPLTGPCCAFWKASGGHAHGPTRCPNDQSPRRP